MKKEIEHWYRHNDKTFLDVALSKYASESYVIKQLCVPLKDDNWSILDINIISGNNSSKNGYVQKI